MERQVATVFGAGGFIGRYVVQRLAKRGITIRACGRDVEALQFLRPLGAVGQIVPLAVKVTDAKTVEAAVAGADLVVNLVGILAENASQRFDAIQAEAPGIIGRAAHAAGVSSLVHVSAIGADPASGANYARTKGLGEAALRQAFPDAVILRPSIVFGPEDGFFNRFASMARLAPALPLIGGGHTRFQPVYVGDVADAVIAGLTQKDAAGKTYELGGPRVASFRECLELMLKLTGRRRALVTLPWNIARLQASVLERLPGQLLTRDQVKLLERDNVVAEGALTLADLGLQPTPMEAVLPGTLARFRKGGALHGEARAPL